MWVGALLYAAGLALMALCDHARDAQHFRRRADRLRSRRAARSRWCSRRCGKLLPEEWRSLAFGAGTAAGSFGQFLFSPLAVMLMDAYGWQNTLLIFSVTLLLVLPFSLVIATKPSSQDAAGASCRSSRSSRRCARRSAHRSYVLLVLGYLHLRLPASVRHHPSAAVSDRPRPVGAGRRLDHRRHRPVQHRRLARLGLARHDRMPQALPAVDHLFRPRARHPRLHHVPGDADHLRSCSAPSWACSGSRPCRRPPA